MPGDALKQLRCVQPKTRWRWRRLILPALLAGGLALLPLALAAAAPPGAKMLVAATIVPLGDFCAKIGGDLVQVQVLIPPGASPHAFEPPPSVMAKASRARVFVYNGAGLEPWAAKLLSSRDAGKVTVVEATRGMPLIREVEGHRHGQAEREEHAHGPGNPHIWLDPVLAQDICRKIAAAFIQADPGHREQYEAGLQSYLAALTDLDRDIGRQAQAWRLRSFVSFHPSFTYFARRYHLKEVGTIEVAPGREPGPRHLQKLVAAVRRAGIQVVFAEPQFSPRVAEVIAQEAGVRVLTLDPVGGRPPYGNDYLQLMRANLAVLDQALQ
jgi:zinc transport system substrate-binding protein